MHNEIKSVQIFIKCQPHKHCHRWLGICSIYQWKCLLMLWCGEALDLSYVWKKLSTNDFLLFSVADPDFTYLGGILNPIPGLVYYLFLPVTFFISFIFLWISFLFSLDCQFELSGADGIIRSSQVEQEEKTKPGQAVDCIWTIKATPKAKVLFIIH